MRPRLSEGCDDGDFPGGGEVHPSRIGPGRLAPVAHLRLGFDGAMEARPVVAVVLVGDERGKAKSPVAANRAGECRQRYVYAPGWVQEEKMRMKLDKASAAGESQRMESGDGYDLVEG